MKHALLLINRIIKISNQNLPNVSDGYLPLIIDGKEKYFSEFWFDFSTDKQHDVIKIFKEHKACYLVFEIADTQPKVSIGVFRSGSKYRDSLPILKALGNKINIREFMVSDGGITTIDPDGNLIGFINFD